MSPLLRKFFEAYLEFAETGNNPHEVFNKSIGLCHNSDYFQHTTTEERWNKPSIGQELRAMLVKDFGLLGCYYPFESEKEYTLSEDLTKNPARIAWIKAKLAEHAEDTDTPGA